MPRPGSAALRPRRWPAWARASWSLAATRKKTEQTRREIIAETGNADLDGQLADLSLMAETRRLAETLLATEPHIDVLVNNAGALFTRRGVTSEGIEQSLALLLLCPFLLTNLLIPRLCASRPSRIVNVSSGGMYTQGIRLDDLQYEKGTFDGSKAYARAKRGLVDLTEMWARRLRDQGVVVHAMHPGWADTPGVESALPSFYQVTRRILRTPNEGADTIVWLASSPEAARSTGLFWLDRQPRTTQVFPRYRFVACRARGTLVPARPAHGEEMMLAENLDPVLLSRIQFAFTVSFHIMFPAFTIGLASWLAVLAGWFVKEIGAATLDQWLANLDRNRERVMPILEKTYGAEDAGVWFRRWRIFFMACSECWGFLNGQEWIVSHFLFKKRA